LRELWSSDYLGLFSRRWLHAAVLGVGLGAASSAFHIHGDSRPVLVDALSGACVAVIGLSLATILDRVVPMDRGSNA